MLSACGPRGIATPSVDKAGTPQELRLLLEEIEGRSDVEAHVARARAYERLREMGEGPAAELMRRGDAADVAVLAGGASPQMKAESAGRLARHFRERAETSEPGACPFGGPLGEPLRRYTRLMVAARFGEYASRPEHGASLERLAAIAQELADRGELRPEMRDRWNRRARELAQKAVEESSQKADPAPGAEALKFCEYDVGRHLEEAIQAAEFGTREKAARGDADRALDWYLTALTHYAVVEGCVDRPSPAQASALQTQDIILRSLEDLMLRSK